MSLEDKLLEINELMSKVLIGKIEHLKEAKKAKTLLEEIIELCRECVHFDGSQRIDGFGYCDIHKETVYEDDSCNRWEG
ncbi:MAG: hypothetical protein ACOCG5_02460 [Candidatus Alkaliphilus sp. MAG34]